MRVLIVDDDPTISQLCRLLLEEMGFAVDEAASDAEARVTAMVNDYDAIVLDLVLPDGHGLPIIQWLRREGRDTPVLVLTASSDRQMLVSALDAGADDFLAKPFEFSEFRARIRALVRRGGAKRSEQLACGNVVLNRLSHEVRVNGVSLKLTAREFKCLEHFMAHANEVVTRSDLLEKVLDMTFDPGTNVVDVNVARLRKKLGDAGATVAFTAVRGVGFVFSEAAEEPDSSRGRSGP
jgi:DNA-binding response OmpR family regulator